MSTIHSNNKSYDVELNDITNEELHDVLATHPLSNPVNPPDQNNKENNTIDDSNNAALKRKRLLTWYLGRAQFNNHMNTKDKDALCACFEFAVQHNLLVRLAQLFYLYIANFFGESIVRNVKTQNHADSLLVLKSNTSYILSFYFQNHSLLQKAEKNGFIRLCVALSGPSVIFNFALSIHTLLLEHCEDTLRVASLKDVCGKKIKDMNAEYNCGKIPLDLILCIQQSGKIKNILEFIVFVYKDMVTEFFSHHLRMAISRFMTGNFNVQNEEYVINCIKKVTTKTPRAVSQLCTSFSNGSKKLSSLQENVFGFKCSLTSYQETHWPFATNTKIQAIPDLLEELQPAAAAYAGQLDHQHKGHATARWDLYANKIWLSPTFLSPVVGAPLLVVTMAQALILRAFANGGTLDLAVISAITGISENIQASITPLASGPTALLFSTNADPPAYTFSPNLLDPRNFSTTIDYAAQTYEILDLEYQQKQTEASLLSLQQNLLSIMILGEYRKERRLSFGALERVTSARYPFASGDILRKHLESLIARGYMQKLPNDIYEYMP